MDRSRIAISGSFRSRPPAVRSPVAGYEAETRLARDGTTYGEAAPRASGRVSMAVRLSTRPARCGRMTCSERLSERDRSEHAGSAAEGGRDDVVRDSPANRVGVQVAVEQLHDLAADARKQPSNRADTAADHDALRRQHADHADEAEREVPGLERPDIVVSDQLLRSFPPTRLDCAPGREALPAIAVVGARALEGVGAHVVRNAQMSELGVQQAVQELSADHASAADPGPDRDVAERVETLGGPPAALA